MTTTLSLTQGIGYRGKTGARCYVAAITGTDNRYGFARTFIDASRVERDHFGRARYIRTYHYDLAPGLYEISEHDGRSYRVVWTTADRPRPVYTVISADRAEAMARMMQSGMSAEDARLATKPPVTEETA